MPDDKVKAPAFQFYVKDFLSDANQAGMSAQETGVYIRLMCHEWNEAGGGIPDDAARCARMGGITPAQMRSSWAAIRSCFVAHPMAPERLLHPRLEKERVKQSDFRRRQSDKGKASAANRTRTEKQPDSNHGSTEPQPDANSPISDLRSADLRPESRERSPSRANTTSGVMAGTLPRDHLNCRPPCIRVCVTQRQHAILCERYGGENGLVAAQALDAFYADVRGRLAPGVPIGGRSWDFWEQQFTARFGAAAPVGKTAGNAAAQARFLARGQA